MTDHDLATLLRRHVADEPTFEHTAADVLGPGRRAVRRSRMAHAAIAVAALSVAAALTVPFLMGDESRPDRAVDPAIAEAIDSYDVTAMPRIMDQHARSFLQQSVPDLGSADFVAFDAQSQRLPEHYWPKASGLVVQYGIDTPHQLSVTLEHSRSSAEGNAGRCESELASGYYLECAQERTPDGDVAITTLSALQLERPPGNGLQNWNNQFMGVLVDDIQSVPADRLWFSRDVKVIKSDTFVTYVSERVSAPDPTTARERLLVPNDDLVAIGLDPALVMPKPPTGENGCSQWTMPTMNTSCSGAG